MRIKRRLNRWQINWPAKVRFGEDEEFVDCQIRDINLKGLQISLAQKLHKNTLLKVSIVLTKDITLDAEAWIVWQRIIDGHNLYGLCFTKIKDSDKGKIYPFVYKYCTQEITKQWWQEPLKKEGSENMDDRRIFERFSIHFPARFLNQDTGTEGLADTIDISAKGIGLEIKQELKPQGNVEVWVDVPDKGEPFYTRGQVAWSTLCGVDTYRAGIEMEKADLMGVSRFLRA